MLWLDSEKSHKVHPFEFLFPNPFMVQLDEMVESVKYMASLAEVDQWKCNVQVISVSGSGLKSLLLG